jgi:hypothetical protein
VVQHNTQSVHVVQIPVTRQPDIPRSRAIIGSDVGPLAETTDCVSKIIELIVGNGCNSPVACLQQQPAECPSQDLDRCVLVITQLNRLADQSLGVLPNRQAEPLVQLPYAVTRDCKQPVPVQPDVAAQREIVDVRTRAVANGLLRPRHIGSQPLVTDSLEERRGEPRLNVLIGGDEFVAVMAKHATIHRIIGATLQMPVVLVDGCVHANALTRSFDKCESRHGVAFTPKARWYSATTT